MLAFSKAVTISLPSPLLHPFGHLSKLKIHKICLSQEFGLVSQISRCNSKDTSDYELIVTGASSGFGRHITEHLLSLKEIVVATLRTPSVLSNLTTKYPPSQLLVTKCDVTKRSDIVSAFQEAKKAYGRVDVVFNNAGFGVFGEIEGIDEKDARAMFDVNFWGAGNVNREAVRFFREENPKGAGGLLLVNTSMVGIFAPPTGGYYSSRFDHS